MNLGLQGRKALIVGASKNIGAAVARCLAAEGCEVFLVSRDEAKLSALCAELGGREAGHDYLAADLRAAGKPAEAAREALRRAGRIDVVVHNVGGGLGRKDALGPVSEWEDVWRFNAGIAIEMNSVLIPPMRERKWGRIVHVSSILAAVSEPLTPFGAAVPYTAAKAYLNSYVRGLGRALASENVVVSAVMPGALASDGKFWDKMSREEPAKVKDFVEHYYPAGRLGTPEEIAPFIALLASEHAAFASGTLLPVSGGNV